MRGFGSVTLLLLLTLPGSAQAEGMNNLKSGVNGILTAPLDPLLMVVTPPDDFQEAQFILTPPVLSRVLAVPTGVLMAAYRFGMGVFDVAFFPVWVFPTLGPPPRVEIIPGIETE